MHTSPRRAPTVADTLCPVCTGIVPARSTALSLDLMAPGRLPVSLAVMHAVCFNALSLTTPDVLLTRASPSGPAVDHDGAIIIMTAGVRFRVTGTRRSEVADRVREAIATFGSGKPGQPIVAFVRRYVTAPSNDGALVSRVTETPGPPPHARTETDPAMTVTFESAAPNRHAAVLARFDLRPAGGMARSHPRYADAEAEIIAFICQRADAGLSPADIVNDLARLPRVQSSDMPSPSGGWVVLIDPTRAAPASRQHGATTNQGPPTNIPAPGRPLSPTPSDNQAIPGTPGTGPEPTASGGPLPPPGEVTRAMLPPLDTPETLRARPAIAASLRDGLARAFPVPTIASVIVDRDPATLAEVVVVTLDRRVIDRSPALMAETYTRHLRDRVPSWATLEAGGLSLIVRDGRTDGVAPGPLTGTEADDEVNLRGLPKWPRTTGTTTAIGKKVAFRAQLWKAIFGADKAPDTGSMTGEAMLDPYQPELHRIRERLTGLLKGYEPEWARKGTLTGYDAVTDHAVVTVELSQGDIHIHTSLSWTMEWNVPDAPRPATAHVAGTAIPGVPPKAEPPPVPKPVDPRDAFAAELRRRQAAKATIDGA